MTYVHYVAAETVRTEANRWYSASKEAQRGDIQLATDSSFPLHPSAVAPVQLADPAGVLPGSAAAGQRSHDQGGI